MSLSLSLSLSVFLCLSPTQAGLSVRVGARLNSGLLRSGLTPEQVEPHQQTRDQLFRLHVQQLGAWLRLLCPVVVLDLPPQILILAIESISVI